MPFDWMDVERVEKHRQAMTVTKGEESSSPKTLPFTLAAARKAASRQAAYEADKPHAAIRRLEGGMKFVPPPVRPTKPTFAELHMDAIIAHNKLMRLRGEKG